MKKFTITFMLMTLVQFAWGQTGGQYIERLDSVVTYPRGEKTELFYNGQNKVVKVLLYSMGTDGWMIRRKREYMQDEAGRDTLMVTYYYFNRHEEDEWSVCDRCCFMYDESGLLVKLKFDSYDGTVKQRVGHQQECSYDEMGRMNSRTSYTNQTGKWTVGKKERYTYDEDGNLIIRSIEYYTKDRPNSFDVIRKWYDRLGRIVTFVLIYANNAGEQKEVESNEYVYQASYEGDDTLLQVLRCQKRGQKGWSWSYVFDKNVSKSSIAGLSYLEEDEGAPQCQNKIMKADEIMEDGTKGSETIYYYSKICL